jgi:hypothetical protein
MNWAAQITPADLLALHEQNAKMPPQLVQLPKSAWARSAALNMIEVWRSRDFLVQVYAEGKNVVRLSVNRTSLNKAGTGWEEGISWDDLQRLKRECGRGHLDAVEVYPADGDVVNVANIRHLWVYVNEKVPFAWRRGISP